MRKKIIIVLATLLLIAGVVSIVIYSIKNRIHMDNFQWWINNDGQCVEGDRGKKDVEINIVDVWKQTYGDESVTVGVLDSGIDTSCDILMDCIYSNSKEIENNGIDDDFNGYIDDVNGWNFYDADNKIYTDSVSDFHGTMVAGIIGGKHDKNGIFGIAPNVKILPLKCFRGTQGDVADVVDAIDYAYRLGVRIFNCSWDTSFYYKDLENTIQKYDDAIFICAGGKQEQNLDENLVYPACFDLNNVICVGAVGNDGKLYTYSGYGKAVDIYAPGEHIYCAMPRNKYIYSEGSSLATAFVTGAVALLKSEHPNLTVDEIRASICNGSDSIINMNFLNVEKLFRISND